jgi:uncharacterized protein YcgL (UPF0745 family)
MGKSTFLENMIVQDIFNDKGLCFIDPHGDSSEYIIKRIPERRLKDLVYFNPSDLEYPIGLNILEPTSGEDPYLVVSGLMQIFAHIWAGSWSSRMEYILSNTLFALLEVPDSTLLGVVRMLSDNDYKEYVITHIKNPTVKNFWVKEYAAFNDKYRTEAVAPILNKIGQFFSSDITLNMMGQAVSTINFRHIMDQGKILIMNLSKGKVGEQAIGLIGSMIITKLQLAAMSRVNMPESERRDFYLYVDEFQNFTTESFATILSEARKYRLALVLAHQYIKQLEEADNEKVKNAVFGNVGTMMTFAIGAEDAAKMELEFEPVFTGQNLVNLSKFQMALKLGIQGKPSAPFLAQTLSPILPEEIMDLDRAIEVSRKNWAVTKEFAQTQIMAWMTEEFGDPDKKKKNKSQFAHLMGAEGPPRQDKPERKEGYSNNNSDNRSSNNNYDNKSRQDRPNRDDRPQRDNYSNQSNDRSSSPRQDKPTSYDKPNREPFRDNTRDSNRDNSTSNRTDRPLRDDKRNERRQRDETRTKTNDKPRNDKPFTRNDDQNPFKQPSTSTSINQNISASPKQDVTTKLAKLSSIKSTIKPNTESSKSDKLSLLKKTIKKDE